MLWGITPSYTLTALNMLENLDEIGVFSYQIALLFHQRLLLNKSFCSGIVTVL